MQALLKLFSELLAQVYVRHIPSVYTSLSKQSINSAISDLFLNIPPKVNNNVKYAKMDLLHQFCELFR